MKSRTSYRSQQFTESVIREMTRVARAHNAVNLSQGLPDFAAPEVIKEAAVRAIREDYNQYAITWGTSNLRNAISGHYKRWYEMDVDPDKNIVVCCGATECMIATLMAVCNPGDEVIVFEPFYENYGPDSWLSGATPRIVSLRPTPTPSGGKTWAFDPDALRRAFNNKTKAIIVNTPHNPTGHVFTRNEMSLIAELCVTHDVLAVTDEIYEFIIYDNRLHIPIATLPGMADRTITISGMSKTFSVTGWRLGYCVAPAEITNAIRKVHDFLTVGAPHPLQEAGAVALNLGADYFAGLRTEYDAKRRFLLDVVTRAGFAPTDPEGAYYIMADFSALRRSPDQNDVDFGMWLIKEIGVATVPGSSFFWDRSNGANFVRFAYCKRDETLHAAAERLLRIAHV
jgi:aminotransferase